MTNLVPLPIRTVTAISEVELSAWVAQAEPGDALEYHVGFLVLDRSTNGQSMTHERRISLAKTSTRVLQLAEQGFIHLVQRRIGPDRFSYLAIARPRPTNAPLPLAVPMPAEAA